MVDPGPDEGRSTDAPPAAHASDLPPAEPPPDIPAGSLIDAILPDPTRPRSPTSPFGFPSDMPTIPSELHHASCQTCLSVLTAPTIPDFPSVMDSITRVVGSPRVFGLRNDSRSYVQVRKTSSTLIDGGANICLTGDLDILVDVVEIPPLPISVAVNGDASTLDDSCTRRGYLPLKLSDGSTHWQMCFFCKNAVETIISPQAILASSDVFVSWTQTGFKDGRPGQIRFDSHDGLVTMQLDLDFRDGLYYCPTDVFTVDRSPVRRHTPPAVYRVAVPPAPNTARRPSRFAPTSKSKQVESEVWLLRLGSPGVHQLDVLPGNVTGLPSVFEYHPFRFIDFKEQARTRKQAAQRSALRTTERKRRFYMDYGFMRSSTSDYSQPKKGVDRVVKSYDGFTSYLLIIDEASRYVWVFLTASKDPPLDIVSEFLHHHGHKEGGCIRTDQGGELARSFAFQDLLLRQFHYTLEPTGADSPSQNGAVETYNDKFAVRARTLLFGSGLPAQYWSAALVHSVYLHNRLVHSETKKTPFEGYYGIKPDLAYLKLFGSRVCVKRTGDRRSKLDRHDFSGIFLGYASTDHNILYLDVNTGLVKRSHHAQFDEAWYLQPSRPPAAQLLYDLGLEADDDTPSSDDIDDIGLTLLPAPWPPLPPSTLKSTCWCVPLSCRTTPLPLRETAFPRPIAAAAARVWSNPESPPPTASDIVSEYNIGRNDMALIYMSPDPYHEAFEEVLDLRRFDYSRHRTAGLCLAHANGRLILGGMAPSTPAAKIPRWRSRIKGAWLIKIGDKAVSSISDAQSAFAALDSAGITSVTLLFSHPEIRQDISHDGLPIISSAPFTQHIHDQLNNRWDFSTVADYLRKAPPYEIVESGDVLNYVSRAMRLTRGKLLKQDDWSDWQGSEYLQLNQYDAQGMFGEPVAMSEEDAVFHLVWTYAIKTVDGRKKARCVCDGSTRSGMVRILAETYANCVDQTSSRLFYAICAAENMLIFGADVSNAFAEAPPPKQGFFIRPDRAFNEWWVQHKNRPPIPDGYVIPILSAMQGHPESPRLWEKHADSILRELGLEPTVHEPCLYSGVINGTRVLLMRQVDDFAIAAPDTKTADILLDMIDDKLKIPVKRQGYLDMYNGIDVLQTRHYIKISVRSFIDKVFEQHLATWMKSTYPSPARSTPLPTDATFMKKFNSSSGDPDPKAQQKLAKTMQLNYRSGVGELIWAMTTCRPDLAFSSVKLSQSNSCPHEIHYHGLKHALKFLYNSKDDGLYFWRTQPRPELPEGPLPPINSNRQDILLDGRPQFDATTAHAYADSDWATCVKTRRSFGGTCIRLAGGTIAYKCKFQPTVAGSSTEAEFMAAYDTGKMILFVRSVLWDLHVPQEAATVLFEDNDGCTAMGNAQKPTTRTRHIDIKYYSICEWIERDLMLLERVDTSINMSDHMTKSLQPTLFHRHADFILGHIPPAYSPVYDSIIGTYTNHTVDINHFIPPSFTTPTTAAAARVHAPILSDYQHNPWLGPIAHGQYNPLFSSSSPSLCSRYILHSGLWGGDIG